MKKKTEQKEKTRTLREHTTFQCMHPQSVERITMALVQSGYWVNVVRSSDVFLVQVYKP